MLWCFLTWQQLKQQRDRVRQYQKKINLQLEKERLLAKRLLVDGKKEWVQYCNVLVLEMNFKNPNYKRQLQVSALMAIWSLTVLYFQPDTFNDQVGLK